MMSLCNGVDASIRIILLIMIWKVSYAKSIANSERKDETFQNSNSLYNDDMTYLKLIQTERLRRLQEGVSWNNRNISSFIHFENYNRTAVIMSGQLRSANITWTSGNLHQNPNTRMFGPDDPFTTAQTIIEWMLKPIALETGIDVFMYLTANPVFADQPWDGNPLTYEPKLGDTAGCEVFSKNELFHNTGNRFFCMVEPEIELMTPFLNNFTMWQTCSHLTYKEQVLQQLYGLYRANFGVKQYVEGNHVHYKYKIRLRPDTAVVKEFPSLTKMDFHLNYPTCKSAIYYANKVIYKNGNEDWFNIGLADAMDHLLDRYMDFVSTPFMSNSRKPWWDLEDHLVGLMDKRYNICMRPFDDIWMVVIRRIHHQTVNQWKLPVNPNQWVELSS